MTKIYTLIFLKYIINYLAELVQIMRILLTGGAGFIGSWVAEKYLKEGHEVFIYDNLSSGIAKNIPQDAEFIEGDVRDISTLENTFKKFRPEIINHHAAQINVRVSVDDPVLDAETNIVGSINLLQLAVKHDVNKFIFASRIAETAITIDGVKVVIDPGQDIETVYDQKHKISTIGPWMSQ